MIALTAAMRPEISLIKDAIESPESMKWGDFEFVSGLLCGKEVVAAQTGVGKVLSAAVSQKLIDTFQPTAIIMSGVGGSINPDFSKGDVVAGNDCIQHDFDATFFGFKRGQIPYTDYQIISADPVLLKIAMNCDKVPVKTGRILTGDQFISGAGSKEFEFLRTELNGDIVEMEGAAAALTAQINGCPFLIIRAVSDKADGKIKGGHKKLMKDALEKNFNLICHILRNL